MTMMNGSDQSETTSLTPSSWPTSPKRSVPVYYVESPSGEWNEEEKSSNTAGSPSASPSAQSRSSSGSRVSGTVKVKAKGGDGEQEHRWRVIEEEEEGDVEESGTGEDGRRRRNRVRVGLTLLIGILCFFCLVIWGISRAFRPHVFVKTLIVNDLYTGQGLDWRGVPTTMLTLNCSLMMRVHNPATFFGIHVTSTTFNLLYYNLIVASGQVDEYYQPRKSWRNVTAHVLGNRVPLYGASTAFAAGNPPVPITLELVFRTSGDVLGRLLMSKHQLRVSCSLTINLSNPKSVGFLHNCCSYH